MKNLLRTITIALALTMFGCEEDKKADLDCGGEQLPVAGEVAGVEGGLDAGMPMAGELLGGEEVAGEEVAGEEQPVAGEEVAGEEVAGETAGGEEPEQGGEPEGGQSEPQGGESIPG